MKKLLTQSNLITTAKNFSLENHTYAELFGITDGKAVGTFIEHKFRELLESLYTLELGSSALGLDLPSVETDIKVTSIRQPQSSCPFRSARQKVYGLGYNLLLFVYEKRDNQQDNTSTLKFVSCAFIEKNRSGDYQTTRGILEILDRDGNRDDIIAFLADRNLPGDEIVYNNLADEIAQSPPTLGYLTISNALQWRLQYSRIVNLTEAIPGIVKIIMNQTVLHIADAVSEYIVEPNRSYLLAMISAFDTVEHANEKLFCLTGIRDFFPNRQAFEEFRRVILLPVSESDKCSSREWGDFQTPSRLTDQVCNYLAEIGVSPKIIIEPTYGTGNFIRAALKSFVETELVYGVEIQEKYEWYLKVVLLLDALRGHRISAEIELHQGDIFTHCFPLHILKAKDVLIVGNPPWVTNAELGALNASNLPAKKNVKALKGMDAMTGKSNFDIGEFVLLRMLDLFSEQRGTLAMLCKNAVIKNVAEIMPKRQFKVANLRAFQIDAGREFDAGVEASLLVMDMGVSNSAFTCQVATLDKPYCVTRKFGWVDKKFVSDIAGYQSISELDGKSPLVWRQGLKHDCARIMELNSQDGLLVNGNKEVVDVEDEQVYWLLKSSDLRSFEVEQARKKVIVTQHRLGADTSNLRTDAPKLWEYLVRNSEYFERRKSRIYQGKSRFSIFGIGEYAFKKYKVAISGLYKEPCFSLVPPIDNRPVMVDDTCYFLGFDAYPDALFTASLLNNSSIKQFIQSIIFPDAKRPYTKTVLMRIDLVQAASKLSFDTFRNFWDEIKFESSISVTQSDFEDYKKRLSIMSQNCEVLQLSFAHSGFA